MSSPDVNQQNDNPPLKKQPGCIVTCLVGIMISLMLFFVIIGNNVHELRREFRSTVFQHSLLLNKDIQMLRQFLMDARVFFSASEFVTAEEFKYFTGFILDQEKVVLIAWVPPEPEAEPTYVRHTFDNDGIADSLLQAPEVKQTIQESLERSVSRTSHAFSIKENGQRKSLVAVVTPTHDYLRPYPASSGNRPTGLILAFIRLDSLIVPLQDPSARIQENIFVYLAEIQNPDEKKLIFQHIEKPDKGAATGMAAKILAHYPPIIERVTMPLETRELQFVFFPPPTFIARALDWPVWTVLVLGIILAISLSAFLRVFLTRNQRIHQLVETRTRELRQSEGRQKAILTNIADGVFTLDANGIIHMINPACAQMFNCRAEDVIGKSINTLIPDPCWGKLAHVKSECLGVMHERTGRRTDQTSFPLEVSLGRTYKEDIEHQFVGVVRDVTKRKHAEEDLKKTNQALDDFVYIVSHDLKEPLRSIQHFTGFLMEDCGAALGQECREHIDTIVRVSKRMQDQIDSLLKFSRASHKDFKLDIVDVGAVVAEVEDSLQSLIYEANASIVRQSLPPLKCDRSCLVEIMTNLLQNAIKYRKEHVAPILEIGSMEESGRADITGPVFYVKDNGIGIRKEHLGIIFKMFKRLHPQDQYGGGTGSGLAIVKKLVERHGGTIWAESEYGVGTTFFFTMHNDRR